MQVGQRVLCKIKSLNNNYFWCDLPNDYQGVVFVNKMLLSKKNISDYYIVGQKIEVDVLTVSHANKKASLRDNMWKRFVAKPKQSNSLLCPTAKGFGNLSKRAKEQINEFKIRHTN